MNENYAYLELLFHKEANQYFKDIVNKAVSKDQFYYSDVISKIAGDVTDKAYFKIFSGLNTAEMHNPELQEVVDGVEIKELLPTKLFLISGFQGMYKILCLEISDEDKSLLQLNKKMLDFEHDERLGRREFKPHITLAYVNADYQIPTDFELEIQPIKVAKPALSI